MTASYNASTRRHNDDRVKANNARYLIQAREYCLVDNKVVSFTDTGEVNHVAVIREDRHPLDGGHARDGLQGKDRRTALAASKRRRQAVRRHIEEELLDMMS